MNLVKLIQEVGGATQVALEIGTPKTHLSALVAGKRGIGDDLAEKIETFYGKPSGWMDQSDDLVLVNVQSSSNVRNVMVRAIERLLVGVKDEDLGKAMAAIQSSLEPLYTSHPASNPNGQHSK